MKIDPAMISPTQVYQLMIGAIVPRPIAWVATQSSAKQDNLAPFSFFNGVTASPPTLLFSAVNNREGVKKDTVRNIEETGEFVVSVVTQSQCELMVRTSRAFEYGVCEFTECGVDKEPSDRVKPYGVKGAPVIFECALERIVVIGEGPLAANLVIGRIILAKIADEVLATPESFLIDSAKLEAVGRMGGDDYVRTQSIFSIGRG
jgi:flavin reductase (DIM6/NTAB) family NADH-FMN oxidoreductase RutF